MRQKIKFGTVAATTLMVAARCLPLFLLVLPLTFLLTELTPRTEATASGMPVSVFSGDPEFIWYHVARAFALIVNVLLAGLLAHRTGAMIDDKPVSLQADVAAMGRRLPALVGIGLIWCVVAIVPPPLILYAAPRAGVAMAAIMPQNWFTGMILTFYGVVLSVYLFLLLLMFLAAVFGLAVPAAIAEERGTIAALRRSAALTKGNRFRIFVLWLLYAIGAFFAEYSALISTILLVVGAIGITVIYAEARRLKEAATPAGATEPAPTALP